LRTDELSAFLISEAGRSLPMHLLQGSQRRVPESSQHDGGRPHELRVRGLDPADSWSTFRLRSDLMLPMLRP
jgi:hypothetical protein